MTLSIVSTRERPDLVPTVARWLWQAFWHADGHSFDETLAAATATSIATGPMPRTFVLLADGRPVGTASLTEQDLDERPDLTPWLAGVFVEPAMRRQGYAGQLVAAVEQAAITAAIPALWLYTNTAERIYARSGWHSIETVHHNGKPFALMRRSLPGG